jgi:tRNA-dihydrouridine synthase A
MNQQDNPLLLNRRLSLAPMLDWTDRFFRYFLRLISRHTLLYTEMITTGALLHGDVERHLRFDDSEHPIAIQLGGSDPKALAESARMAEQWGYDEVNLNLGCPSDRVQNGRFGACLMAEPGLVADCIRAMKGAVTIPVTVKTRIGIDHNDSYEALCRLISVLDQAGSDHFIIHARKAWLQGLSPRENREIPPLRYEVVSDLKRDFPHQTFSINGGIKTLIQAKNFLQELDGVMIGREAYHNPWLFAEADRVIFGDQHPVPSRQQILDSYLPFVERALAEGVPLKHITRHLLGLYHGVPGAKQWRRLISEEAHLPGAGVELIHRAAALVHSPSGPLQ